MTAVNYRGVGASGGKTALGLAASSLEAAAIIEDGVMVVRNAPGPGLDVVALGEVDILRGPARVAIELDRAAKW